MGCAYVEGIYLGSGAAHIPLFFFSIFTSINIFIFFFFAFVLAIALRGRRSCFSLFACYFWWDVWSFCFLIPYIYIYIIYIIYIHYIYYIPLPPSMVRLVSSLSSDVDAALRSLQDNQPGTLTSAPFPTSTSRHLLTGMARSASALTASAKTRRGNSATYRDRSLWRC